MAPPWDWGWHHRCWGKRNDNTMEELRTEFVPTKRVEANRTPPPTLPGVILHQPHGSLSPSKRWLRALREGSGSPHAQAVAVLGEHVKAPPPNLSFFSLSFPLFGLLQLAPTHRFGTAPARRAWDENNKATKIFRLQSFCLYATYNFSVMSNGLMTLR